MDISLKVVTEIPLVELWTHEGFIEARRERYLVKNELKEMLKQSPVEFVIANVGDKLTWIPVGKCYENWTSKIKAQVTNDLDRFELEEFPSNFIYVASEWTGKIQTPIILLEKHH